MAFVMFMYLPKLKNKVPGILTIETNAWQNYSTWLMMLQNSVYM